ncbi:MAG: nickel insertion protein, partial [Bacteroidota bacterium]
EENKIQLLSDFVLENTSTIGVRYYPVERNTLKREIREYKTEYGYVKAKTVITPSGKKRIKVEYEDLKRMSKESNLPLQIIQEEIINSINFD